jgi:hypothetical protein
MLGMRIYREFRLMDGVSSLAIEGLMLELVAQLSRQFDIRLDAKRPRWLDQARDILEAGLPAKASILDSAPVSSFAVTGGLKLNCEELAV